MAAAAVLLWGNAAPAQSAERGAAAGPSPAAAKQAYALAEAWAQRGRTPEQTVSIEAEGLSAICVTLRLQGRNLTDETIRHHTSFLKDILPAPGRDIRIVLRAGF